MSLRELLTAAHAAGWRHAVYAGSFGREHVWKRGDTSVHLEHMSGPAGDYLTVVKDHRQVAAGRVDTLDQTMHLLAAYGLIDCPCRVRLMRTLDDLAAIRQAGRDAVTASHRRLLALHAHDGDPLGGAS